MRLAIEVALARAVGSLSRLAGRGGGTTLPGKLLAAVDREAITRLAARLEQGSVLVSATNGKTTTCAMAASILAPTRRLARNAAGANLVSGVISTLLTTADAELGLFEVDEAALPEVARRLRPRAVCLANLFRDQLDRYGELEIVAERWRGMVSELGDETVLVVNADDPLVGDLPRGRIGTVTFGMDDPFHARPALQHAADSKFCVRCGTAYAYRAAYVGHLGDFRVLSDFDQDMQHAAKKPMTILSYFAAAWPDFLRIRSHRSLPLQFTSASETMNWSRRHAVTTLPSSPTGSPSRPFRNSV